MIKTVFNMELIYIKVLGNNYYPMPKNIQDTECIEGVFKPYCIISKLKKGKYKIEYPDYFNEEKILIVYPASIELIEFKK
jgi:hypothetical protein